MSIKFSNILTEAMGSFTAYHGSPYNFDKFDFEKIGSSEQGDKYGHGLYFTPDKDLAIWYAKDSTLAKHQDGLNLYEVRLISPNLEHWDQQISYNTYEDVHSMLDGMDMEDAAEEFQQDQDQDVGYEIWTGRELYEWLVYTVGGRKEASIFLRDKIGIDGFIVESDHRGEIITMFNDELIKIVGKIKI
jgi:hypothetical protein